MAEAERRIEEARKTKALDLGDLGLVELPASLGKLVQLKVLSLGRYRLTETGRLGWDRSREPGKLTDLAPLAGLQALQSLDLSFCTGLTALDPLVGLQALQTLDLSFCKGLTDLAPLAGLQALQTLDLSFCKGLTDLDPLAGLQALQSLDLSDCTGLTDLAPLAGLQTIQSLHLSGCTALSDLAPLAGLKTLQNLDLSFCPALSDLAPLAGLQALQTLSLSGCPALSDLAPVTGLRTLQSLHLSYCPALSDLAPLAGLQALQSLDLAGCPALSDLAPLAGLQALQTLYLYGSLTTIPERLLRIFADHPHLTKLVADEAAGIPREVLSHNYSDNCLPRLRSYLSELDLGTEAENEVKVILLGNGRVGKTQLCRRFRGQPFSESIESTHGVQIWREELRIQMDGEEQTFQVNWWDFGGQEIYHGTHALFLRSRAVFLILWTPELENRKEYEENGIPLRNQPLTYWLDYVRTLAGQGSPVIVVQSQCDRFTDRRSDPPRPGGSGFFECCSYSAKEDVGRDILEGHLRNAIRSMLEQNGALGIGHGRAEVRRRLYAWRTEDQERAPEERLHRTLTCEEFRTLCEETGGIVSWEHALDYFHHTGVVFYDSNLFSNRILLDQDWALDAVYTVFHRGRTAPWLRDSGCFTREDLAPLAWPKHSIEEQKLFLGLMESCGVCFPCGETAKGEARYIAPDLLPGFKAVAGRLQFWNEEPGTPKLRLEYRFFHPAVIRGLMSEIGQKAGELAEYWKYGLWFKDGQRDSQLLVRFKDTSTDDAPGAGALELKAQGRDPLGLLREIRWSILRRQVGAEPEELLTLNGTTVARSALTTVIEGHVLDIHKAPVPAAAFTAFFENREHQETPVMDITPQPLTATEKPREVFLSYAWGDDTPAGKIREQAADALTAALIEDGFLLVRDRDRLHPGDRISAFIHQLTHAGHVVAVISDKYLRSPYCMYEIYKLWQKRQDDGDAMLECLVPIVLPEVRIDGLAQRAPYLKHWREQASQLEALIVELGLSPGTRSWEEVRLVREFAHHIDDILFFLQDVLMPRQLEAHLDNGFEAVREALRRRMGGQ